MIDWKHDEILDSVDTLIYAIDPISYRLKYANNKAVKTFPAVKKGALCYRALFGAEKPCSDCPITSLGSEPGAARIMWSPIAEKWYQITYQPACDATGKEFCICTAADITAIAEASGTTKKILNSIHAAAYSIDVKSHRLRYINQQLQDMLPEVRAGDICYKALWGNDEQCRHCPIPQLSEEHPTNNFEIYNNKLGRHLSIDSVYITSPKDDPLIVFTGYDISRRVASEKRLLDLAFMDQQYLVKNNPAFIETLRALYDSQRQAKIAYMVIKNIDRYNMIYGREAGDKLLRRVCEHFKERYGQDGFYKIGGAKFAFVAETDKDRKMLDAVFASDLSGSIELHDRFRLHVDTVMIEIPEFACDLNVLIHNCEHTLRKTKLIESSQIIVFEAMHQKNLIREQAIENALERKLADGSMEIYFQPIYCIEDNSFCKCEALMRMHDERLGWVSPAEFIPIAETAGYIKQLGRFALECACKYLQERQEKGLEPILINVNVSTVQLYSNTFYEDVAAVLDRYKIDPGFIRLEATESIMINSFEYIISVMRDLAKLGISFSLDDFGTGYSSLSYIGALPISELKIDRSFIVKLTTSEAYLMIIKNIVEIAKGLNFKIVAEGVETKKQLEILKKLGCDYIQGFYFSKPLPKEDFDRFLEENAVNVESQER